MLWRGLAEVSERYLKKGSQVYIEGKLQTRSYEDKDGVTKYSTEIVGQTMTMLGGRAGENNGAPMQEEAPKSINTQAAAEDETNDLPF